MGTTARFLVSARFHRPLVASVSMRLLNWLRLSLARSCHRGQKSHTAGSTTCTRSPVSATRSLLTGASSVGAMLYAGVQSRRSLLTATKS